MTDSEKLEKIIAKTVASKKYKVILPETIRDVYITEFGRHKNLKATEEVAKKKLHRIRAEYLGEPDFRKAKEQLKNAFNSGDDEQIREVCKSIFSVHSSTRERNSLLEEYYEKIFSVTGRPESVTDLACAFNPLSFRWMGLPKSVLYHAYDVNTAFVDLINYYFDLEGVKQLASVRDIYTNPPDIRTDVAYLFKMYYCLEHRLRGAGWHVVEHVNSPKVAISFPTINLVDKKTDILGVHESGIKENCARLGWKLHYVEFDNEITVVVEK